MSREGVTIRKFRKDFDKNVKFGIFSVLVKSLLFQLKSVLDFMTVFNLEALGII